MTNASARPPPALPPCCRLPGGEDGNAREPGDTPDETPEKIDETAADRGTPAAGPPCTDPRAVSSVSSIHSSCRAPASSMPMTCHQTPDQKDFSGLKRSTLSRVDQGGAIGNGYSTRADLPDAGLQPDRLRDCRPIARAAAPKR